MHFCLEGKNIQLGPQSLRWFWVLENWEIHYQLTDSILVVPCVMMGDNQVQLQCSRSQ